jgi:transposase
MRPLNSHFAHNALPPLDSLMKHSKEARVFRRAQAVREVVAGQTVKAVSDTFHFTNSARRKWVHRFAREGTGGLFDRPRSGRPATMTGEIETQLNGVIDQAPLPHGSIHSPGNCRELATVLSQQSEGSIGRERVRVALKKHALSDCRPTGTREPNPADLA